MMETNVAMQHAPEKWAAGEALYEQPEKVTYIYGCQKKGRETRGLVKPSRSYDNQLESAVGRDIDVGLKVMGHTIRDDLSISWGQRPDQVCQGGEGRAQYPVSGHGVLEKHTLRPGDRESSIDYTDKYSSRHKCKTKRKSSELSHRSRHQNLESRLEDSPGQKISNPFSCKQRSIPVEFHLTEDQLPITGPTVHLKRPVNLSSPASLTSSFSREKPSSLVILEIKDGPTFFYKPSDHMLSDVGMGDEVARSSSGYFSSAQAAAGYASPDTAGSYSKDTSNMFSNSAYKGSLFLSNSEESSYSPLRRDTSTASHSVSPVSIGAAGPSLEETSRFRSKVSHLPRTPGLRKPDLSVLSTAHKSKVHSYDNGTPSCDLHKQEPVQHFASLPFSATYTILPSVEALPEMVHEPSITSTSHTLHNLNSRDSEQTSAVSGADMTLNRSQNSLNSLPATEASLDVSCGFQNISEIIQQKAGIKHDDIVVGPRRPKSGVYQDDFQEAADASFHQGSFDFLGPELVSKKQSDQAGLSLSTDGLSVGYPTVFLKAENNRRKHTQSESEISDIEMSAGDSRSKYSYLKTNLNKVGSKGSSISSLGKLHSACVEERAAEPAPSKVYAAVIPSDAADNRRQQQKKPQVQQSQSGKVVSGHNTELRSKAANLALSLETSAPYSTKSLDRNLKYLPETEHTSKSANTSPAKQQQSHSPKFKSSLPTPFKKHSAGSKLHMLSNIPVPICHDPPVKRDTWQRPPSTMEHEDAAVPSVFENDSASASSKSSVGNLFPKLKPEDATQAFSEPSLSVEPTKGGREDFTETALHRNEHVKTSDIVLPSRLTTVLRDGRVKQSEDTSDPKAAVTSAASSSVPAECILQQPVQSSLNALTQTPTHTPARPRLHRSAEHLLGEAKLTVFNSAQHVPHFEPSESSNNRAFQDSPKLETVESDNISPLKKNHGLAKTGIVRRGSDRTEMYRRGSERAILSINQNDPSVEDLKKATSLKELCHSMASLLNIDNVRAAEMITTSLSHRQDLVEGLDADAILDYLSHHGVLDPGILIGLDDRASITQRNSAILRHVEEHGNTAVALFINALRQSGQLHLASSLDTEQRIQPVSGSGYFGKDRHKGELTIRIEIESLKIIAPREPRSEKIVDTSLLGTPGRQTPDDSGVVVKDASDEEDFVKPRSCWCFCLAYKSKVKSMSKKEAEKQKKHETHKPDHRKQSSSPSKPAEEPNKDTNTTPAEDPSRATQSKPPRTKSQEKPKKGKDNSTTVFLTETSKTDIGKSKDKDHCKKSKVSKSKSKVSGKHSATKSTDASSPFTNQTKNDIHGDHAAPKMTLGMTPYILQSSHNTQQYVGFSGPFTTRGLKPDKESWHPIIMEYDPKLELIKLRAGQEELASPTRQSGNIGIMCEQWKSNGRHFQQKASLLCETIVQVVQTEIIKYFEQDRGTLVLDITPGISSIVVINICMKRAQVRRLQQEIADKSLLTKMEDMFFSRVNISDFDIRGVNLRIILDEQEVNTVLSELS